MFIGSAKKIKNIFCLIILTAITQVGCTTAEFKPDYLDKNFDSAGIDNLTVLPVADLRKDKSYEVDSLEEEMLRYGWTGYGVIQNTGYSVNYADNFGSIKNINDDDVAYPTEQWISQLGSNEDRLILLIALADLGFTEGWGAAVRVECKGFLYDKKSRRMVWSHSTNYSQGAPGLLGIAVKNNTVNNTMRYCTANLMLQFPKRK